MDLSLLLLQRGSLLRLRSVCSKRVPVHLRYSFALSIKSYRTAYPICIALSANCLQDIRQRLTDFLSRRSILYNDGPMLCGWREDPHLSDTVEEICLCDADFSSFVQIGTRLMSWQVILQLCPTAYSSDTS